MNEDSFNQDYLKANVISPNDESPASQIETPYLQRTPLKTNTTPHSRNDSKKHDNSSTPVEKPMRTEP